MTISMYASSVPVFKQMLGSLDAILGKTIAHCSEKKIEPQVLFTERLFPNMFPLNRQVQIACDFAKGISARLANVAIPKTEDKEQSLEELQALIHMTLSFLDTFTPTQFEGSEEREIITRPGTPKEKKFIGQQYLLGYGLPQFFFHVTTAYNILRHNGVELGKGDYMGKY